MSINLSALMKQRYDTAANWTAQNPTLLAGEIGIESDTKKWKVGTGSTAWTSLTYAIGGTYPIVNADIAAGAAIAYSKLATLPSGNIVLGSAANVATSTAVTGDVTISNTGVTAIAAGVIVNADINASAAIAGSKIVAATTSVVGAVQLTDSASSTSTTTAATPAAVKVAKDAADAAQTTATAALPKAGGTMTGAIVMPVGSASAPSLSFTSDVDTGIFSAGASRFNVAVDTSTKLEINTTSTTFVNTYIHLITGNSYITFMPGTSGYTIDNYNSSTGIWNQSNIRAYNHIFSTTTTGTTFDRLTIANDGTVNIPGTLTKNGSNVVTVGDTGTVTSTMILDGTILDGDINASAAIVDTKLATIATAGKVSNSATTAASVNTASAIVARDASGNFTAGTITAALTGAASANVLKAGDTMTGVLAVTAGTAALPGIAVSGDLNTGIYSPGADQLAISTGGTVKATIDSSGRLLVGTSTYDGNARAVVQGNTSSNTTGALVVRYNGTRPLSAGESIGTIRFESTSQTNANYHYASISCDTDGASGSDTDIPGRLVFSTTADGAGSPTERMRIDALGALKTSPNGTYKFPAGTTEITHNDATSTIQLIASSTSFTGDAVTISTYRNTVNDSYKFLSCIRQGFAVALEIRDDGDVYNVNGTYGSLSDVKLKENIVDANSQWDDIRQLRVRNYNFKPETNNSTHKQIGVIAQEIEDVSPGLVNTVPDRDEEGNDLGTVTKSVNYSVLYMKAVKALQEAMERIETLEARLTAAGIE